MVRRFTWVSAVVAAVVVAMSFFTAGASYARDWEKLGERHVGFISDHDTVEVGRHAGKFKRIRLHVEKNDIELNSVKIVFANGDVEDYPFQEKIRAGGHSPNIDLRTPFREGRHIREIRLHYHSRLDFKGEALVEIWAQED